MKKENGEYEFVLAENGHIRDRNINQSRAEHLNEIVQTKIDFFQRQHTIQDKYAEFKNIKFPAI